MVSHGETGLLINQSVESEEFEHSFANALSEILSDESLARKLGVEGRSRAIAEFGWDKVASATIDLYRSLI